MQLAIAEAFNEGAAPPDLRPYQLFRESVRMHGFTVTDGGLLSVFQNDFNPFVTNVHDAGVYQEDLPPFAVEFTNLANQEARDLRSGTRAASNNFEGVFIDDIVIGFAERGETVSGANVGTGLAPNPNHEPSTGFMGDVINQIDSGDFQLNIRLSADYEAVTVENNPTPPQRTYDTNDVIDQSVSLQFGTVTNPLSGGEIADGTTISISDSQRVLLFEFDNADLGTSGVTPGNIAVPYTSDMTSGEIVAALRDAINQPFVQDDNEFRVFATSNRWLDHERHRNTTPPPRTGSRRPVWRYQLRAHAPTSRCHPLRNGVLWTRHRLDGQRAVWVRWR